MTPADFRNAIFTAFYTAVHRVVPNNFDLVRHSNVGDEQAKLFALPQHTKYMAFFLDNYDKLAAAHELLADEASRETFVRIILYRLLGHHHVAIKEGFTWPEELAVLTSAKRYDRGVSQVDIRGHHGKLSHFEDVPCDDGTVQLDCWVTNVAYTALKRQYYATHGEIYIGPKPGDTVIDAGGCFGDTAVYFARSVGPAGRVFCFDPLPSHGAVIRYNIAQNGLGERLTSVEKALSDTHKDGVGETGQKASKANPGFSMATASDGFSITTIDAFRVSQKIPKINFIKMDIEGFEMAALHGAQDTISTDRPTLALSLYHKMQDLYEIPLWLRERFPFYDFFLDHYSMHQEETVLFAVPRATA